MTFPPMKGRHEDNEGYTLVELIVVIAIMATMIGLLSLGISMLFSKDAERVAKFLDDQISEVRMSAMSKPGTYSIIIHTTDTGVGNYIEIEKTELSLVIPTPVPPGEPVDPPADPTPTKTRVDFSNDAKIIFGPQSGAFPAAPSNDVIQISFDKANGSITKIKTNSKEYSPTGDSLDQIFEIKCIGLRNTTKSASILLMPVTGRHFIE